MFTVPDANLGIRVMSVAFTMSVLDLVCGWYSARLENDRVDHRENKGTRYICAARGLWTDPRRCIDDRKGQQVTVTESRFGATHPDVFFFSVFCIVFF